MSSTDNNQYNKYNLDYNDVPSYGNEENNLDDFGYIYNEREKDNIQNIFYGEDGLKNKINFDNNTLLEKVSTVMITDKNLVNFNFPFPKDESPEDESLNESFKNEKNSHDEEKINNEIKEKEEELNVEHPPTLFSFQDIKERYEGSLKYNNIINIINIINNFQKEHPNFNHSEKEFQLLNKKRKLTSNKKYGIGRKSQGDNTERVHDKTSSDNIMKKIKAKFIENLIKFLNRILNLPNVEKQDLKDLDYQKYINRLKREKDLEYLQMKVEDLVSLDISPKFKRLPPSWNKNIIHSLTTAEKNKKVIEFVLNMKFSEWINLFTMKTKISSLRYDIGEDGCKEIENKMPKLNLLLDEVLSHDEELYSALFIFYLNNYEFWFFNKRGRTRIKKKEI